jgi:hypothetical protein
MFDAARWMIAIAFITLPTIAFGGAFLLSILRIGQSRANVVGSAHS